MKHFRWPCSFFKSDRLGRGKVCERIQVTEVQGRAQDKRAKWHGHKLITEKDHTAWRVLDIELDDIDMEDTRKITGVDKICY